VSLGISFEVSAIVVFSIYQDREFNQQDMCPVAVHAASQLRELTEIFFTILRRFAIW
jgi:hypothetical protein